MARIWTDFKQEHTEGTELFAYCVNDFWEKRRPKERTLPFREISVGHGSPGQIFKLPKASVRDRLESIRKDSGGTFEF